jgi:hypothetical protein
MPLPEPIGTSYALNYSGMTSAELTELHDSLAKRRLSGVLWTRYADGSGAGYRSDAEIATALASVEGELARRAGAASPTTILVSATKGLES